MSNGRLGGLELLTTSSLPGLSPCSGRSGAGGLTKRPPCCIECTVHPVLRRKWDAVCSMHDSISWSTLRNTRALLGLAFFRPLDPSPSIALTAYRSPSAALYCRPDVSDAGLKPHNYPLSVVRVS